MESILSLAKINLFVVLLLVTRLIVFFFLSPQKMVLLEKLCISSISLICLSLFSHATLYFLYFSLLALLFPPSSDLFSFYILPFFPFFSHFFLLPYFFLSLPVVLFFFIRSRIAFERVFKRFLFEFISRSYK